MFVLKAFEERFDLCACSVLGQNGAATHHIISLPIQVFAP